MVSLNFHSVSLDLYHLPDPKMPESYSTYDMHRLGTLYERIFGVVKWRFRLLVVAPEYSLKTQAKMVPAICVLHNFIRIYDVDDLPDTPQHSQVQEGPGNHLGELGGDISTAESNRASALRDSIAQDMWASYQAYMGYDE